MINANELRIGSCVMYNNRLFQIEAISRSLPCLNTDEFGIGVVDWNNIEPMPLTPEILEKCGFEKKQWTTKGIEITCYYYQLKNIVVYPLKGFFEIELITPSGQFNMFKSWNYLHQLQNLYFALTGEELTYKL